MRNSRSISTSFSADETVNFLTHQIFTNHHVNAKRNIKLISFSNQKLYIHLDKFEAKTIEQELFIIDNIYDQFLFLEVASGFKSAWQAMLQAYDYRDYGFTSRHFFKLFAGKSDEKKRLIDENLQQQIKTILDSRSEELLPLKKPKFISPFSVATMVLQGLDIAIKQNETSTSLPKTHPHISDQTYLILAIINLAIKNCGLQNRFQIDAEIIDNRSKYFLQKTDNNFPLNEILLQLEKLKSEFRAGWKGSGSYFVKQYSAQEELDFYQIFGALYQNENNFLKIDNLVYAVSKEDFLDFQSKIAGYKISWEDFKKF